MVSEEKWEKLTSSFFDSMKHPIEFFSFEETFGEVSDGQLVSAGDVEKAQRAFDEFLAGERSAGNVAVKDIVESAGGEAEYVIYDSWMDFKDESELPYVDAETYGIIKDAYLNIDFFVKFEIGNKEYYDEYKEKYWKVLCNEKFIIDKDSSKKMLISEVPELAGYIESYGLDNMVYYYFDVDGDSFPELCIQYYGMGIYILDYNSETEEYSLWYDLASFNYALIGTQKVMWRGNGKFFSFYLLNEDGEEECETFFFTEPVSEEINICIVMLPWYKEDSKNIIVSDQMNEYAIYARSEGWWYFRVTEQQYNELTNNYKESYHTAIDGIKEVTYNYEELFGTFFLQ